MKVARARINRTTSALLSRVIHPYFNPATTRYVRKTGNDTTGNGTYENPWLTVQKAVDALSGLGGITVRIGDGVYQENRAGTGYFMAGLAYPSLNILEPENGASGNVTIKASASAGYNVRFDSCKNLKLRYIKFTRYTTAQPNTVILRGHCQNITFYKCTFSDTSTTQTPVMVTCENVGAWDVHDILFDNCTFNQTGPTSAESLRLISSTAGGSYVTSTVTVRGCTFNSSGLGLRLGGITNALVENNTISGGTRPGLQLGEDASFGYPINGTVQNNTISSSANHAFLNGAGCDGVSILNNHITGGDHCLVVKECTNTTITGNTLIGGTMSALYYKAATYANASNNTISSSAGSCVQILRDDATMATSGNWQLQNNTITATGTAKLLTIGDNTHDSGGGVCDYNTYTPGVNKFGTVRSDTDVQNITELRAAWSDYDVTTNDSHSTSL